MAGVARGDFQMGGVMMGQGCEMHERGRAHQALDADGKVNRKRAAASQETSFSSSDP